VQHFTESADFGIGATDTAAPLIISSSLAPAAIDLAAILEADPLAIGLTVTPPDLAAGTILDAPRLAIGLAIGSSLLGYVHPAPGIDRLAYAAAMIIHLWTPAAFRYELPADLPHYTAADAAHYEIGETMTQAPELFSKTAAETKELTIDFGPTMDLAGGETIATMQATTQTNSYQGTTTPTPTPDPLTLTGETKNAATFDQPGRRPIASNEGLQLFAAGGTADFLYFVTFNATTTKGQILQGTARLHLTAAP
jgi:hypothetical protein